MKPCPITLAVLLPLLVSTITSCLPDNLIGLGRPSFYSHPERGSHEEESPAEETGPFHYACAVSYPEGYDWRQDSSFIREGCRVLLYCNSRAILELRTGKTEQLSPDPDSHHIIDGQLYTEYSSAGRSCIKCNGETILDYPEREKLCGLLRYGKDWYSLGRNRDGGGFTFRKNGEILLKNASGTPFGDFGHPLCGQGGALYQDTDGICFFHSCGTPVQGLFLCRNGTDELIFNTNGGTVLDAGFALGEIAAVYSRDGQCWLRRGGASDGMETEISFQKQLHWISPGIHLWNGRILVCGCTEVVKTGMLYTIGLLPDSMKLSVINGKNCMVYSAEELFVLELSRDGPPLLFCYGTEGLYSGQAGIPVKDSKDGIFIASPSCGKVVDGQFLLAVSPFPGAGPPYLLRNGSVLLEYGVNGYISGIEVSLKPPN
ncbi:MAG: hypothetical protein J5764_02860 [Bacteroidales bacterium]|nr:hypothetical protein [Bacteroidales bacterium]